MNPRMFAENPTGCCGTSGSKAEAHAGVLDQDFLDSSGWASRWAQRGSTSAEAASDLRRSGALVGLPVRNKYLYPSFQVDESKARVHPVVADVNRLLGASDDPWGSPPGGSAANLDSTVPGPRTSSVATSKSAHRADVRRR